MPPESLNPVILVIFGISGDLTRRKILPALYRLVKDNLIPDGTKIVGTSRRKISVNDLLNQTELCVLEEDKTCDPAIINKLRKYLVTIAFDPADVMAYPQLKAYLESLEAAAVCCMDRLYYLAIPPQIYGGLVERLGQAGLNDSCAHGRAHTRLLVEKPFGYDLASAQALVKLTRRWFKEEQVFRIDHFLAKETVQNILTFRANNPLFSVGWDNRQVYSIEVNAFESIGIEGRVGFYDNIGALRDLIQSHLMQLLALVILKLPQDLNNSPQIHRAKQAALMSLESPMPHQVSHRAWRGQYDGYREEVENPGSLIETYAAVKLFSRDPTWQGVPLILRSGKALKTKLSEIVIVFGEEKRQNRLTFRLQPNEGIDIELIVKRPGFANETVPVWMDFNYAANGRQPDAYERVLVDAIKGDHTLFATSEEVLSSWRVLEPLLVEWAKGGETLTVYPKGMEPPLGQL